MKKKTKLILKIGGLSLGVIPAAALTLAQLDIPTAYKSNYIENKTFFRDCAKNNPNFATQPLTKIGMLASHDALSDDISMGSRMNPHQQTKLSKLANVFGKGAIVRLSRAQNENIYNQLNAGVRYIDARITHVDGQYYTCHGLISNTLEHYLKLILQWLDENPGEFVMFHIYYFYYDANSEKYDPDCGKSLKDVAWEGLGDYIKSVKYNGKSLFDYDRTMYGANPHFGELTYNTITNNGTEPGAVIFFSSDDINEANGDYWCDKHITYNETKHIYNPCAVRMDSNILVNHVNNAMEFVKKYQAQEQYGAAGLKYIQTQTTPNAKDIDQTLTAWSLINKAHDHNYFMLHNKNIKWYDPDDKENSILYWMPIYMCDFCTCNDNNFCTDILKLLTKYNLDLKN